MGKLKYLHTKRYPGNISNLEGGGPMSQKRGFKMGFPYPFKIILTNVVASKKK